MTQIAIVPNAQKKGKTGRCIVVNFMYSPDETIDLCFGNLHLARTFTDVYNICIAARMAWERKEMGGLEHVQFAYRNGTPIVPLEHCCHPLQLVKRGFVDGVGWPTSSDIYLID